MQDNITVGSYSTASSSKDWYLSARSLDYGLYFVQYTVTTANNDQQIGYDYGFLKITPGPLYVYIDKGSSAVYVEKRNMTLDGSATYDPDFFAQPGRVNHNVLSREGRRSGIQFIQGGVDYRIFFFSILFSFPLFFSKMRIKWK